MFPDVMVDIETTGTSPDNSAIIQLAAVRFNVDNRTVDTTSMFNRCMAIPTKRYWDESTRHWWGQQKPEIFQDIMARAEKTEVVLNDFVNWAGLVPEVPHRFWGKPTHFDFSFVSSYLNQFDIHNPFHYRYAVDMNSFIRGLGRGGELKKVEVEFQGDAHNAIFDCLNQIEVVFKALEEVHP